MPFRKLLGTLFVLLLGFAASAEEIDLKSTFEGVINQLLQKGVEKIRDLDIRQLQTDARLVEYSDYAGPFPAYANQRRTAFYSAGRVYTGSAPISPRFANVLNVLAVHETLGALGYNDRDYQLSTSLVFIAESPEPFSPWRYPELQITFSEQNLFDGGATSIGGGGDLAAAWYKAFILELVRKPGRQILDVVLFSRIAVEPAVTERAILEARYEVGSIELSRSLHRIILEEYQRTGRRVESGPVWLIRFPLDEGAQTSAQVQEDIRQFVEATGGEKETVATCGPYMLNLPIRFYELEIVKNSESEKIVEMFYKICRDISNE